MLVGELVDGSPRGHTGDVHHHIHRLMVGVDVLGEGGHRVVVGDVQNAVLGHLGTQRTRVGDGFLQPLGVTVSQVELGALCGQFQRRRAADPAGGPGEKATLAGEFAHCPPQNALSHNRSTMSTARSRSSPRPTKVLSWVKVIVVVAANVRTKAGRSSEIGRASGSCSSSATSLSITLS